jgi:hypothetical protein
MKQLTVAAVKKNCQRVRNGCWYWLGATVHRYGVAQHNGRAEYARRRAAGMAVRGEYTKRDRTRINPDANVGGAPFAQGPAETPNPF